jgi:hypothetical protein
MQESLDDHGIGTKLSLIGITMDDIIVSSPHLPESKGIELKSFSININYDIVSSVVVMYS